MSSVKGGLDVLLETQLDVVRGRRVGLITNPTGVDGRLQSGAERLRAHPEVNLVALYGPEHGIRGEAQAGEGLSYQIDPHLGLPVFSLYGAAPPQPGEAPTDVDARMRRHDTQATGKTVESGMLDAIDLLLFDLQDVGTRVYTYVATMAYAMQAAASRGIPFVVLDRPNPINGVAMEGPLLEYPTHSSFVGLYPVPLRHGMTVGELAQLFNARFLPQSAALTVVPVSGWRRRDWFDATDLPWVMPSPNLPTLDSATVYPGQVLLEGTNLSEGRGTTRPFELFGAPWIDGYMLARDLNALQLPGVVWREAWFTPTFSKFAGQRCGGCQLHVREREAYHPVATTLALLQCVRQRYGPHFAWHADYFDKVMGTASVRVALERDEPWETIVAGWEMEIEVFAGTRAPFLLYR